MAEVLAMSAWEDAFPEEAVQDAPDEGWLLAEQAGYFGDDDDV